MATAPLTIIFQDIPPDEATGIARHTHHLLQEFTKQGVPFRPLALAQRDVRLGPLRFGYYQRIAWHRFVTRPGGAVHTMYTPVIPPGTRIVTVWDLFPFRPGATNPLAWRWILRGIRRDLVERPDVYVALTDSVRSELHGLIGVPLDRIRVARPGVDTEHFRPGAGPRPPEMPQDGKTTILHVGLGYRRKGIHLLVDALGLLGAERFRLVRVGPARDEQYVADYHARAKALGLDVTECGHVADARLPAFYANADLFAFPSLDEGAGIPPIEALACGTNAVVSDIPAHREMCGSAVGYAAPEANALSTAIEAALEHPRPAEELRRYAEACSWTRAADVYVRLYREFGLLDSA